MASAKWLQAAVGVTVDGKIGPQTIAAALQRDPAQVINTMCSTRLVFKTPAEWGLVADFWSWLASAG